MKAKNEIRLFVRNPKAQLNAKRESPESVSISYRKNMYNFYPTFLLISAGLLKRPGQILLTMRRECDLHVLDWSNVLEIMTKRSLHVK